MSRNENAGRSVRSFIPVALFPQPIGYLQKACNDRNDESDESKKFKDCAHGSLYRNCGGK